jgi:hypothetical protein
MGIGLTLKPRNRHSIAKNRPPGTHPTLFAGANRQANMLATVFIRPNASKRKRKCAARPSKFAHQVLELKSCPPMVTPAKPYAIGSPTACRCPSA